jgi:uncharacterized protein YkwD
MHVSRLGRLTAATVAALAALAFLVGARAGANLVAPGSKCDGQRNIHAAERDQEDAMRCLLNYARKKANAGALKSNRALERAAGRKAGDVMRCGPSHTACGRPADAYAQAFGYMRAGSWIWGENIGWGRSRDGSAKSVFKDWLNSGPHRETMLRGSFEHLGIGLKRGSFQGHKNSAVWVIQLGCHGC